MPIAGVHHIFKVMLPTLFYRSVVCRKYNEPVEFSSYDKFNQIIDPIATVWFGGNRN